MVAVARFFNRYRFVFMCVMKSGISTVKLGDLAGVCDDTSGRMLCDARKTRDHYAHVFKRLTIYRHKTENGNPKKKSTG